METDLLHELNAANMSMDQKEILKLQKKFLREQQTLPLALKLTVRLNALKALQRVITAREKDILHALAQDLGKPAVEAMASEYSVVFNEIKLMIKNLPTWIKGKKVSTNMINLGASSREFPVPYGQVLVISPWNYPFQLIFLPLIGALAAGNSCVIKPSEFTPHVNALVKEMLEQTLSKELVLFLPGGPSMAKELLSLPWDYIFFTGSSKIGKIVYESAAKHLTPVTLELGGKSPCLVTPSADLKVAAHKIIWGKFFNVGQTCVAPDYLLIHESIFETFKDLLSQTIKKFYGEDLINNKDYGRIINHGHFDRLVHFLNEINHPISPKDVNREQKFLAPQLISNPPLNSKIMEEEIFGPLLVLLPYKNFDEALEFMGTKTTPLSAYFFGDQANELEQFKFSLPFGGGCINDTIIHLSNPHLSFGGMGASGLGKYRGQHSFETFSHFKSILHYKKNQDLFLRYPPYGNRFQLIKWMCTKL